MNNSPVHSSGPIYVRRCHICNSTNETENHRLETCGCCGKFLAPFLFCNDVGADLAPPEILIPKVERRPGYLLAEYPPIYGISLYW